MHAGSLEALRVTRPEAVDLERINLVALHLVALSPASDLNAVAEIAKDSVRGAGSGPADRVLLRVIAADEHTVTGVSNDHVALHQIGSCLGAG